MGLFSNKQTRDEAALEQERKFLDESFKEELRNHARLYFKKVLDENGEHFKSQLDETVTGLNTELKDHVASKLDETIVVISNELKEHVSQQIESQLAEQTKTMAEVQQRALQQITDSAHSLQHRHTELASKLEKSLADQEAELSSVFSDSKAQATKMKDSHQLALQWMSETVKALQNQHEQLAHGLEEHVRLQQESMIKTFEDNMARIVEHYVLGALGDQYDVRSQLPSIIKQMEDNKQAIADDMKL